MSLKLYDTFTNSKIKFDPIVRHVAAISCGIVNGEPKLDLNYEEDSSAATDANFVMDDQNELIEIQCSAEKEPFSKNEFEMMYSCLLYTSDAADE